ncbi:MAG: CRISPR-associated protein [Paludibacteraceae bacterium]|nr:CRISPR-associated protein [Paludibacteraceae bacterium]
MLINLSNHPSDKWSKTQTAAANEQFGEIVDLPFPQIEPDATKADIAKIAQDYLTRVQQIGQPNDTAIHIMGEMTLTYQLVGMLKDAGYRCYASTTVREVYEQEPDKKIVIFQFVSFREY